MRESGRPVGKVSKKVSKTESPLNLTPAELFCEELTAAMRTDPSNHHLWEKLFSRFDSYPGIHSAGGAAGGSTNLVAKTMKDLNELHIPHCENPELHKIIS